jgi:uncharacterized protein (TIGR02284 family)
MARNENTIQVLNDLIRINNDRVDGYEKAISETKDSDTDLKKIFNRMAEESRSYRNELTEQVRSLGGDPASDTTASGKIYRVWMDMKASFTAHGRYSILEACEYGEDAAQKAYEKALDAENDLLPEIRTLVQNERSSLRSSHDTIKNYRDMQRTANKNS